MRFLLLLAPLLLAASSPPKQAHPALWVVRDVDTTIYLLGTIHALPAGVRWEDARIARAVAASERLVLETVLGDATEMAALVARVGGDEAAGLPPLATRVAPRHRPALAAMLREAGLPATAGDGLETWAAAFLLSGAVLARLGFSPDAGVEEALKRRFTAAGRPIEGLETVAGQLGIVDDLAEADQRLLLGGFVGQADELRAQFAAMLAAWARGDDAAIARTFDRELKASPALRAALITRRNAAWADRITAEMTRPGTIMVAVGAGHLAGADSVQAMLRAKELRVERVR